jgi:hypothetical protein
MVTHFTSLVLAVAAGYSVNHRNVGVVVALGLMSILSVLYMAIKRIIAAIRNK